MVEEKKEDIAFEIFEKRVEELKEMTENIGKKEKQNLKKDSKKQEEEKDKKPAEKEEVKEPQKIVKSKPELSIPKAIKKDSKKQILNIPSPIHLEEKKNSFFQNLRKRVNSFEMPKIKLSENKKTLEKSAVKKESLKIPEIKHPLIESFFGLHKKQEEKNIESSKQLRKKIGIKKQPIKPKKIELYELPEPLHTEKRNSFFTEFKKRVNNFKPSKIKFLEIEKTSGEHAGKKELITEKVAVQRIPSAEKHEIFDNLKRLEEKIDKNKEEVYDRLIREAAESKRMIEIEREEIKNQMLELLSQLIDKLDSKDEVIKTELYDELQKIKNRFFSEKKEIREIVLKGSDESRKSFEAEKEKLKDEFLGKIANLRNRIVQTEKKTGEIKKQKLEKTNDLVEDKNFFSLFNRFKILPSKIEVPKLPVDLIKRDNGGDLDQGGDIITGWSNIPKPENIDLGMPELSFMSSSDISENNRFENESFESKPFFRIEKEAIDNEYYEQSIKNILSSEKISKFDSDFEKEMQKSLKKGMKEMEKNNIAAQEKIRSPKKILNKNPIYLEEDDFNYARQEIEKTKKRFHNFEKNIGEKIQIEKKEHEKIAKILVNAEEISNKFSKINSAVLGKIKI